MVARLWYQALGARRLPAMVLVCILVVAAAFAAIPVEHAEAANATQTTVKVGKKSFTMKLANTDAAAAFRTYLSEPRTLKMKELNGNEKYRYLAKSLPANAKRYKKVRAGDVMLYGGDCMVIFYKTHKTSYSYTKIGKLLSAKGLAKAAGKKAVKVRFAKMKQPKAADAAEAGTAAPAPTNPTNADSPAGDAGDRSDGSSAEPTQESPASPSTPAVSPSSKVSLSVNGSTVTATLDDNQAAREFAQMVAEGPLTLAATEYGGFEKVAQLGRALTRSDAQMTTSPGDLILYNGSQLCIHYGSNTWSYTRLGRIDGATADGLKAILGSGDVTVVFAVAKAAE